VQAACCCQPVRSFKHVFLECFSGGEDKALLINRDSQLWFYLHFEREYGSGG
jgi:hypothetical protein